MQEFFAIIVDVILPVFVLIGSGAWLQRKFRLDLNTLTKLNIYYFVPGLIFVKLYETEFSYELLRNVLFFFVLLTLLLYALSHLASKIFRFSNEMRTVFTNSVLFYNSGNYGVPVNDLVFKHDPFAMSIQVLVLALQNMLTFSYGIYSIRAVNGERLKAALSYFKMPIFYAMLFGIGLNVSGVKIPPFLWEPARYVSDALIAVALLTLGAQVANLPFSRKDCTVYMSLFVRLIIGPAAAFVLVSLMGLDGIEAQALVIASAMPTSVNSAIIAQEYGNESGFATQVVLASTLLSAITVSCVIFVARTLF